MHHGLSPQPGDVEEQEDRRRSRGLRCESKPDQLPSQPKTARHRKDDENDR